PLPRRLWKFPPDESDIPERPHVYLGVRFRTETETGADSPKMGPDQGKQGVGVTGVTPLPVNQKSLRDTGLTEEGVTPVTETSVSPAQAAILTDPAPSNGSTPCPEAGNWDHEPDFCAACVMAARARTERRNR